MDTVKDNDLAEVVSTGLAFIRAITERYGVTDGSTIYNDIIANIDSEAKGAIMFAMLTGGLGGMSVTLHSVPNGFKIEAIRAIRAATGLGLKESKDLVDLASPYGGGGPTDAIIPVYSYEASKTLRRDLRKLGCQVS